MWNVRVIQSSKHSVQNYLHKYETETCFTTLFRILVDICLLIHTWIKFGTIVILTNELMLWYNQANNLQSLKSSTALYAAVTK